MKIIGIAGTNGSGKDTLSQILADDYDWLFISTSRDLLIPELKQRGLPIERKNMAALTTEWRREKSKGVVIDKAVEEFKKRDEQNYKGLVISSLRHPWEVDRLHELGGQLVWVDADPKLRFQRVVGRKQGVKDQKTFEQFLAEEDVEMTNSSDDNTMLNMSAVKTQADVYITNNGTDISELKKEAKKAIGL